MVPRSEVAQCQQAKQVLHTENARLRDQNLALQTQNRDYADRAVDDARRIADQEEAIHQLRETTLAYQNDISRLEAAFKQLTANLGDLGMPTSEARAWPRSNSRSASAADKKTSIGRLPNGSAADDPGRLR